MLKWVVAAGLVMALPAVASAQDAEAGKAVFNKCRACHDIGPNAKNKVGPHLNDIFGRKAGSVEGFNYSDALKNSGIVWDEASIDAYVADPKGKIPGNKMVFVGIKDEADRKNLIAFLKAQAK
jgi:cytochrome c